MDIQFLKKEKSFHKKGLFVNPYFFWRLAVLILCMVAVFSAIFGYYLFAQINKDYTSANIPNDSSIQTVNRERIDKVLEYFAVREQKSNEILNSPSPLIDPSL